MKFLKCLTGMILTMAASMLWAQPFVESSLPIVMLNTRGATIPDGRKIDAIMQIIDNGPGGINRLSDSPNGYDGCIGIEIRGSSSTSWPKKQYNVETRKINGENNNTPLLGLPKENDWILNAPFIDRSFMRNTLIFQWVREAGHYASRFRFCVLTLNGGYQGVYVLLEKIKRDKNRVNLEALTATDIDKETVTGGYILKIDKPGDDGFASNWPSANGARSVIYQYHEPEDDEINTAQKQYIQQFIADFESSFHHADLQDSLAGYRQYIDAGSFVDFFLFSELSKNVDAYRLSTYLHKDRDTLDGRLKMGPVWDFNLAFGNANYYDGADTDGWTLMELSTGSAIQRDQWQVPFWWMMLLKDDWFVEKIRHRWIELRQSVLSETHINAVIDSTEQLLQDAAERNFQCWTPPGGYGGGFWPVPEIFYQFKTYQDEVHYLKSWIHRRLLWMDAAIPSLQVNTTPVLADNANIELYPSYPNPMTENCCLSYAVKRSACFEIRIVNVKGECVCDIEHGELQAGLHSAVWEGRSNQGVSCADGLYFWQVICGNKTAAVKIIRSR